MPRTERHPLEHAHRGKVAVLPRQVAGAVRFLLFRARYPRVGGARFSIARGAVFDIGPRARVSVGRGTAMGRQFSGSFQGDVLIGSDVWFGRGATISAHEQVHIGDGCVFAEFVSVHDNVHRSGPAGTDIDQRGYDAAPVVLGARVLIGAKATILPGVTVGADAIVAAGAVVTHDVEAGSTVAGVPARRVG